MKQLRLLLYPFSIIYGAILRIRNFLYDAGILASYSPSVPMICVGNLSMGGTGKSPHIEYLIQLLNGKKQIATLSRGYGRKIEGFRYVNADSNASETGDEPLQFKQKFGTDILVAVDANRKEGITRILNEYPGTNLILLDDAFQHRAVKAGMNILLSDYAHPFFCDFILPAGNLREPRSGVKRADIVVITKCPHALSEQEKQQFRKRIPGKKVFFSTISYQPIRRISNNSTSFQPGKNTRILLLSGIANTDSLHRYVSGICGTLEELNFPDHHRFSSGDIEELKKRFAALPGTEKIILTTEKDAMRLREPGIAELLGDLPLYDVPIRIAFDEEERSDFEKLILDYVK